MPDLPHENGVALSADAHRFAAEVRQMAAAGVRRAQEEARAAGVPCVYSINGILHWELPDGSLTTEDPWAGRDAANGDAVNDDSANDA